MSSLLPYIAPWRSGFERYATQIFSPAQTIVGSLASAAVVVPNNQWWRVIYLNMGFQTVATAGNRTVYMEVLNKKNVSQFRELQPLTQQPLTHNTYLWAPGVTAFTNTTEPTDGQATATVPDVLWPQDSQITMRVLGVQAGDAFGALCVAAIEVYTELREHAGVLTPTPQLV